MAAQPEADQPNSESPELLLVTEVRSPQELATESWYMTLLIESGRGIEGHAEWMRVITGDTEALKTESTLRETFLTHYGEAAARGERHTLPELLDKATILGNVYFHGSRAFAYEGSMEANRFAHESSSAILAERRVIDKDSVDSSQ